MSHPDHLALQQSAFNPFLFADVGTELNGSTLTMLSVIARLGKDPWIEAARWAKMQKPTAIEGLISTLTGCALSPQTAEEMRATATRVVMLLPVQEWLPEAKAASLPVNATVKALGNHLGMTEMPRWLPMVLLSCSLVLGVAVTVLNSSFVAATHSTQSMHVAHQTSPSEATQSSKTTSAL